jgi:hypothetical protein
VRNVEVSRIQESPAEADYGHKRARVTGKYRKDTNANEVR